jgi:hypothetical protein
MVLEMDEDVAVEIATIATSIADRIIEPKRSESG